MQRSALGQIAALGITVVPPQFQFPDSRTVAECSIPLPGKQPGTRHRLRATVKRFDGLRECHESLHFVARGRPFITLDHLNAKTYEQALPLVLPPSFA